MNKNIIKNDMAFREKCGVYGLDWDDFNIYENIIILNSPKKDIFVLLDENYNTIGIHKLEYSNQMKSIEEYAIKYRNLFNCADNSLDVAYPFQNFSLKQIVDLANRVFFYKNHVMVNGKYILDTRDNVYVSLLAYSTFLGMQIEQYFLQAYQMKMLGFEYPEVHSYFKSIITNIDQCINMHIINKTRPFPIDIIQFLGQKSTIEIEKWDTELYEIIDLLLYERGFKVIGGGFTDGIETIDKCDMNLADLSLNLLKIIEIPKDKIGKNELAVNMEMINLQYWLEQGITKKIKLTNPKSYN